MNFNHRFLKIFENEIRPLYQRISPIKTLKKNNDRICNFYREYDKSPYLPISAYGPWIITDKQQIVYDVGGYGMLGFGHNPSWLLPILSKPHVMANVMTPSYEQETICSLLSTKTKYDKFAFLNSGSEGIEFTLRYIDRINKINNNNSQTVFINLKSSFHGRTMNAASISDSSKNTYLKKTNNLGKLIEKVNSVEINNILDFDKCSDNLMNQNKQIMGVIMEPVMGEGNPGEALTPEFYNFVRGKTKKHNIPLVIDSVQAGLRTNGCLSISEYKNFQNFDIPDFEIFSKAITGGHYPLSIIGINKKYSNINIEGIYGNSMCANPKALEVCEKTLNIFYSKYTTNVLEMGKVFKQMLLELKEKYPKIITNVNGTGLLLSAEIDSRYPVSGYNSLEYQLRTSGLNVIHGGKNALRFTPHFGINKNEIRLIYNLLDSVLKKCKP